MVSLGRQARRFLAVGAVTALLDYAVYRSLLLLGMPVTLAKVAGFVAGTTATYVVNRRWTFRAAGGARVVARFLAVYAATLLLNLATNAAALRLLEGVPMRVEVAFLLAQAATSTANFVGLRLLVFAATPPRHPRPDQSWIARPASSRATGTRKGEQET